jgi:triacylglycerol lipase
MNMPIIEVAIGLTFMFLVLSFFATAIAEGLTEWRQWRGRLLHTKLETLLGSDLVAHLYSERRVADLASGVSAEISIPPDYAKVFPENKRGRIADSLEFLKLKLRSGSFCETSLKQARQLADRINARRLPSHIPEGVFADVLLDWLQGISLPDALRPGVPNPQAVPYALAELWQRMNRRADGDQTALRSELVAWYQQVTERLTGEFKRQIRLVLYMVGFVIVLASNADSIKMVQTLYGNPQLRAQVAATAGEMVKACPQGVDSCHEYQRKLRDVLSRSSREASSELLGWRIDEDGNYWNLWSPVGWLLTILAIGMGADFWFRALKKLVSVKNAKAEPSPESGKLSAAEGTTPRNFSVGSSPATHDPIDINVDRLAPLKGFQPLIFAESNVHAFWLAQFASLAYSTLDVLKNSDLLGLHQLEVRGIEKGSTQVFLFRGDQMLVVAFRGTEQLPEDWITDANVRPEQQPWNVKDASIFVHQGFQRALDLVWAELREELIKADRPIWFTGHSLGGALAVLAAYRLVHCEGDKIPTIGGVYTFGQPRVGNAALASSCSLQLSQRIFRYVNSSDIVPLVPPSKPIDYDHFGNARYFDAAGNLHRERTLWERVAEQLTPALRAVAADEANWGAIAREHLRQRVADHAMARYVQCLERIDSISLLRA